METEEEFVICENLLFGAYNICLQDEIWAFSRWGGRAGGQVAVRGKVS